MTTEAGRALHDRLHDSKWRNHDLCAEFGCDYLSGIAAIEREARAIEREAQHAATARLREAAQVLLDALHLFSTHPTSDRRDFVSQAEAEVQRLIAGEEGYHTEAYGPSPDTAHLGGVQR